MTSLKTIINELPDAKITKHNMLKHQKTGEFVKFNLTNIVAEINDLMKNPQRYCTYNQQRNSYCYTISIPIRSIDKKIIDKRNIGIYKNEIEEILKILKDKNYSPEIRKSLSESIETFIIIKVHEQSV